MIVRRSRHDLARLRTLAYKDMTREERIAACKAGITPPIRSERERQLRSRYGLTLEDYDAMWQKHGGRCWVCRKMWKHNLYVDHCHKTGENRGLVCASCNSFIGYIDSYGTIYDFLRNFVPSVHSYLTHEFLLRDRGTDDRVPQ